MSNVGRAVLALLLIHTLGCGKHRGLDMERRGAEAVLRTDLKTIRDCPAQYRGDRGACPASLDALVAAGYLHKIPIDPITHSAETWVAIVDAKGAPASCGGGVYDIRSGSDRKSLDGAPYSGW